jgi:regulator of protease activity HflC (stomatin/prohibitin superfamily)
LVAGIYTVNQNERGVKTVFGRAERVGNATTLEDPISDHLGEEEKERYAYPQVRVIPPGGPYFRWPWERVYKVSVATQTINMAFDPETPSANQSGTVLEAVTKDQLNTGLTGQIRYRVSEKNLYAYMFGVKRPIVHVMGYFTSVLRERIANFEAPPALTISVAETQPAPPPLPRGGPPAESDVSQVPIHIPTPETATAAIGVSINDLRKNLRDINEHMDRECASSEARYGMALDASLITGIDPPQEVESALAAINTAYNQVSSDISLAQAAADQKLVQSKTAVEIETLKAQAEVEPLRALAEQLRELKKTGPDALQADVRNVRLKLFNNARRAIIEVPHD